MNWISEYIEKRKEFSLHNRTVTKDGDERTCPYCLINPLGDSVIRASEISSIFFKRYNEQLLVDTAELVDEFRSIRILVGKVYAGLQYLDATMLKSDFNLEAYLSVSRNLIEKLGLLNHIMRNNSRAVALDELYTESSLDIERIINVKAGEEDRQVIEWIGQNGWSTSTVESRVTGLKDSELRLLYAYMSRLVHGINRDEMLKRPSDVHYIAAYVYLTVVNLINKVLAELPEDVFPTSKSLRAEHKESLIEIESMWECIGGLRSILTLTGFGIESLKTDISKFMDSYNAKLEEVVATGLHFFPKIKHKESE